MVRSSAPKTPASSGASPSRTGCTGGRVGTAPNCRCPGGTQWTGRACVEVASGPPADPCLPGLTYLQGRCVQLAAPQMQTIDPGALFDARPRPRRERTSGGGSDSAQRPASPTPATTAPPPSATVPLPSSSGVLRPGGSNAAQALRCQPPQTLRDGRCVCANGMLGANCDQSHPVR
jgi:hypothetical protein